MREQHMRMKEKIVLRVIARSVLPFILLFALYVQFHGDYGPGGGFQAGVIFSAGFILYGLIFGMKRLEKVLPWSVVERGAAVGLLLYGGVGVVAMLMQGHYLDYRVLQHDPQHGLHLGILLVELGIGITVTMAMLVIFYAFAERKET